MALIKFRPITICLLLTLGSVDVGFAQHRAQVTSPSAAVNSFYNFHLAHNTSFTRENVRQRRKWFAPDLYQLLLNEFRREARWVKANPDQVPYFDGDPFTNSQELPGSFRVSNENTRRNNSSVDVTFVWTDQGRTVATRDLSVTLRRFGNNWLITNIVARDASANGVNLRRQLSRKVYQP